MIGVRLAKARAAARVSQFDLSVLLDCDRTTHVEANRAELSVKRLQQAALSLKVSVDYLFSLTDDPRPTAEITAAVANAEPESIDKRDVRAAAGWGAHVEDEPVMGRLASRKDWLSRHGIDAKKPASLMSMATRWSRPYRTETSSWWTTSGRHWKATAFWWFTPAMA